MLCRSVSVIRATNSRNCCQLRHEFCSLLLPPASSVGDNKYSHSSNKLLQGSLFSFILKAKNYVLFSHWKRYSLLVSNPLTPFHTHSNPSESNVNPVSPAIIGEAKNLWSTFHITYSDSHFTLPDRLFFCSCTSFSQEISARKFNKRAKGRGQGRFVRRGQWKTCLAKRIFKRNTKVSWQEMMAKERGSEVHQAVTKEKIYEGK